MFLTKVIAGLLFFLIVLINYCKLLLRGRWDMLHITCKCNKRQLYRKEDIRMLNCEFIGKETFTMCCEFCMCNGMNSLMHCGN